MAGEFKSRKVLQKENFKIATSVFLSTILAAVLNFIIYMSFTVIFTGLSTKTIGERIYERINDKEARIVTEIYYDSTTTAQHGSTTLNTSGQAGSTAKDSGTASASETTANAAAGASTNPTSSANDNTTTAANASSTSGNPAGTTNTTLPSNQYKVTIRSEMPKSTTVFMNILSQLFMLILYSALIYSKLWMLGDRDINAVNFGRMEPDKLRGLRIGLLAAIPSFVFYLLLVLAKLKIFTEKYLLIYRFLNISFMPIVMSVTGQGNSTAEISWLSILVILLTVAVMPMVCFGAYLLGYNHISLSEKIIYVNPNKKKKKRRY